MKANNTKKFTVSEIKYSFLNNVICSFVVLVFSLLILALGKTESFDITVLGFVGL